jgi:naphthalene 1,2-dioxygenase system ferredoxin subunit
MDESKTPRWTEIMPAADLERGGMLGLEIGARTIAIYHLEDDSFHATDNICTHAFAHLSDGWLEGGVVECPLHGGCFDVRTGKAVCAPVTEGLATYPVEVRGGKLFALLENELTTRSA